MRASTLVVTLLVALLAFSLAQPSPSPSPAPNTTLEADEFVRVGIVSTLYRDDSQTLRNMQLDISYNLWADNFNAKNDGKGMLFNGLYKKVVLVRSEAGDPSNVNAPDYKERVATAARKLCSGEMGRIDFMIAAYSSTYAAIIGDTCDEYDVPVVTGNASGENVYRCFSDDPAEYKTCTAKDTRRFTWSISVDAKAGAYFPLYISLMKIQGVETLSLFYEDASFPKYSAEGVLAAAATFNIQILLEKAVTRHSGFYPSKLSLNPGNTALDDSFKQELYILVDEIIAADADAVAGGTYSDLCRNILIRLHEKNYLPKSIALNSCLTDAILNDIPTLVPYVYGPSAWDRRLVGKTYSEDVGNPVYDFVPEGNLTTAEKFLKEYVARDEWINDFADSYDVPIYQAVGGYVCGYAIAETIRLAKSFEPRDWLSTWHTLSMETVYGPIQLDAFGHNQAKEYIILQVDENSEFAIAAPLSSATANSIYPMPQWSQRSFDDSPYNTGTELAFLIVVTLFVILTICLMIAIVIFKKKPQIVAASFLFCELISLGALLVYTSLYFWSIWTNTFFCNLHLWLMIIGFDIFLGALLVKNYKIAKIFYAAKRLKKTDVADKILLGGIGLLMIFDVIVLIVWQAGFPIKAVIQQPSPYRPSLNYYQCVTHMSDEPSLTAETVFISLLGGYKVVQIIMGVVMAYFLRNTPTDFNEARYIGYAIYNLFISIIILFVVWRAIPREDYNLSYLLRQLIVIWSMTFSLLAIFFPKFYFMAKGRTVMVNRQNTKSALSLRSMASMNDYSATNNVKTASNTTSSGEDSSKGAKGTSELKIRKEIASLEKKLAAARKKMEAFHPEGQNESDSVVSSMSESS